MERKAIEALNFAKTFAEEQRQFRQRQGREEDFCRFLCSELKKIKVEENFDNLKYNILDLVKKNN